jgi:macrolide phosphotransferase
VQGVLTRARELLPHLDLARIGARLVADGWDHVVLLADSRAEGGRWAIRFARRADVTQSQELEEGVLERLAPALPGLLPVSLYSGTGWRAYPALRGRPVTEADLQEGPVAGEIGALLAVLHGTPVDGGPVGAWEERVRSLVDGARRDVLPAVPGGDALGDRWLALLATDGIWPQRLTLTHGDLCPEHLLVAPRAGRTRLAGVLDWADTCAADPAVDLAGLARLVSPATLGRLLASYAAVSSTPVAEVLRMATMATLWAELAGVRTIAFGSQHDRSDLVRLGLDQLAAAAAQPAGTGAVTG